MTTMPSSPTSCAITPTCSAARNNVSAAKYNLKSAQVTPVPDIDVHGEVWKEVTVQPKQNYLAASVSIPFPLWDKNRGGIMAAEAGLVRAAEGPHQVEVSLTSGVATAYAAYKSNLYAMEYYRQNILPDLVRYYRGVFERRKVDPAAAFGDLVVAQQLLATDVASYLQTLGTLWTSVVNVANFLQTDDLYQLGKPMELPRLPDLDTLNTWPCPHPGVQTVPVATRAPGAGAPAPALAAENPDRKPLAPMPVPGTPTPPVAAPPSGLSESGLSRRTSAASL